MRRVTIVFMVTLSMALVACGVLGERGSGTMATLTREVSGFDAIDLSGSGTVRVSIADTESLTIEAEDNILPLLTTEVRNGTLVLGAKQSISPTREIVYTITAVSIESLAVSGSGSITAARIDATELQVDISGSGAVTPTGIAQRLDVSISGSGAFDGEGLTSTTGAVSVSGSGRAIVDVTDDLDVDVSGSGSVEYFGDPNVSTSVSGSGRVSQR